MDCNEILKSLQEKYPEDLNEQYKCFWWCTQRLDENHEGIGDVVYYVCVRDKWGATEENPEGTNVLIRGSQNIDKLETLLKLFLEVDEQTSI